MAVYTHVSRDMLRALLAGYDLGSFVRAEGIAEGVENSNYLVETTAGRFILTLFEKRVAADDLPFFVGLLDHLAARGQPVPPALRDRVGCAIQMVEGRPAALFRFLPGIPVRRPTARQARSAGEALGRLHQALVDFEPVRRNDLGLDDWRPLLSRCGRSLDRIAPGLFAEVSDALARVEHDWPRTLPQATIHADLFPDNVLMDGDRVGGLIDFYFACTDLRAYDLAVMHGAWGFDLDGEWRGEVGTALVAGYDAAFGLTEAERRALPTLAQGASIRFLLTRAWDWLNTPADAMVTRKDPLAYLHRLRWYQANEGAFR